MAAVVYCGLCIHYRLFSDILEAPYLYWREYYSGVLIKRLCKVYLASCALSVMALVLLVLRTISLIAGRLPGPGILFPSIYRRSHLHE